jgi:hypothetical protein
MSIGKPAIKALLALQIADDPARIYDKYRCINKSVFVNISVACSSHGKRR